MFIYDDIYRYELNNHIYDHNKRDNDGIDDDSRSSDDDCAGEYSSD